MLTCICTHTAPNFIVLVTVYVICVLGALHVRCNTIWNCIAVVTIDSNPVYNNNNKVYTPLSERCSQSRVESL